MEVGLPPYIAISPASYVATPYNIIIERHAERQLIILISTSSIIIISYYDKININESYIAISANFLIGYSSY